MVYIDQPAGTGFSPGPITVNNEYDVAAEFKDFWKRFMNTFGLHGKKVYVTGESYAGMYGESSNFFLIILEQLNADNTTQCRTSRMEC